jgi:hypothetical protein
VIVNSVVSAFPGVTNKTKGVAICVQAVAIR